jgi:hypothetical protein
MTTIPTSTKVHADQLGRMGILAPRNDFQETVKETQPVLLIDHIDQIALANLQLLTIPTPMIHMLLISFQDRCRLTIQLHIGLH